MNNIHDTTAYIPHGIRNPMGKKAEADNSMINTQY